MRVVPAEGDGSMVLGRGRRQRAEILVRRLRESPGLYSRFRNAVRSARGDQARRELMADLVTTQEELAALVPGDGCCDGVSDALVCRAALIRALMTPDAER